ncbi:MAG TPA: sodium:solute symporter, partial [Niabella sp.]
FKKELSNREGLRLLHVGTVVFGLLGMFAGVLMIGIKSVLDIWWQLSGIFAGGMLGLFLLGIVSKKTGNAAALGGTIIGILVILWMSFSYFIPDQYAFLRNPLHANMIIVVGTLTLFLAGLLLTGKNRKNQAGSVSK